MTTIGNKSSSYLIHVPKYCNNDRQNEPDFALHPLGASADQVTACANGYVHL